MVRILLKGVNQKTVKLASGIVKTYYYLGKGGPRLHGVPGSPEFMASYESAAQRLKKADASLFQSVVADFKASRDFGSLAHRSQLTPDETSEPQAVIDREAFGRILDPGGKLAGASKCRGGFRRGMATPRSRSRIIPKAWGLVTSWIRCVPTRSCVWPLASLRTVWASHTFSKRVLGMGQFITWSCIVWEMLVCLPVMPREYQYPFELRHLVYFREVARRLHFRKAAEALAIAQPALSRQIAQLEAALGARLLNRSSRRVELTPAGAELVERIEPMLSVLMRVPADVRAVAEGRVGRLRVAFTGLAMATVLPDILRGFHRRFPGIRLELNESPTSAQIAASRARRPSPRPRGS